MKAPDRLTNAFAVLRTLGLALVALGTAMFLFLGAAILLERPATPIPVMEQAPVRPEVPSFNKMLSHEYNRLQSERYTEDMASYRAQAAKYEASRPARTAAHLQALNDYQRIHIAELRDIQRRNAPRESKLLLFAVFAAIGIGLFHGANTAYRRRTQPLEYASQIPQSATA